MATLTTRDRWIRSRWSRWLRRCLRLPGVTVNSLSRQLAGGTRGDYRGTIKAYCRGTTTVSAERAFEIGEAIAELAPCGLVNGPFAVAIAGYYDELVAFLDAFTLLEGDDSAGGSALIALHVPFMAEFELAKIGGYIPAFMSAALAEAGKNRDMSTMTRIVRNGVAFLSRSNTARYAFSLGVKAGLLGDGDGSELFPVVAAWRARNEPPDPDESDEYASDRRALVAIARSIAGTPGLDSYRLSAVVLDVVWQWSSMVDASPTPLERAQVEILRTFFRMRAEERHYARHPGAYEVVEVIPGIVAPIPSSNTRLLSVPLEDRVADLLEYDRKRVRALRTRARALYAVTRKGPYAALAKAHVERFLEDVGSSASAAEPEDAGMTPATIGEVAFRS